MSEHELHVFLKTMVEEHMRCLHYIAIILCNAVL